MCKKNLYSKTRSNMAVHLKLQRRRHVECDQVADQYDQVKFQLASRSATSSLAGRSSW